MGWDIFDFSSETAEQKSLNFDRKQNLKVLFHARVFRTDWKNKMAALVYDWPRHIRLLLKTTEQNSTKLDRKHYLNVLYHVFVFGPIGKTRWPPWSLIGWDISTSRLTPLNGIQRNWTGSKISISSTKFVFFRPIEKTRWPPWYPIHWNIFDFSSETAKRNSSKLDSKQDINIFYQVCALRADRKNKMAAFVSDLLRHFRLFWDRLNGIKQIW